MYLYVVSRNSDRMKLKNNYLTFSSDFGGEVRGQI